MVARCVCPSIEKSWKRTESAARKEAERQAQQWIKSPVIPTGRTFHTDKSWNFEFTYEENA